jgi:NADPH:quinone reductase-like Zn-dependent oxidoreductase
VKPSNVTHEAAAASGLAALAAWEAIITYGQARAGQKVLIHGAAGGVGHFAVQLARHLGAFVIGTGSPASKEFVIGLGVDQFIDYTSQTIENLVQDADLVLDPMPGPHIFQSLTAAKPGGRVISLLPYDDHDGRMAAVVNQKRLFTHRVVVSSNGGTMKEIASLLQSGVLKPHLSMVFPFAELPLAHSAIDTSHTKGKIVVLGPQ